MKIIYGKGECSLSNSNESIKSIVIKYKGSIALSHQYLHFGAFLSNDKVLLNNVNSKVLLVHGNNQIHIGVMDGGNVKEELFNYMGDFRIISAKVNNKNIPIEVFGIDTWNMIDSDWDYAGKPEIYKGTYKFGRVPQKKRSKGKKNKMVSRLPKGRY